MMSMIAFLVSFLGVGVASPGDRSPTVRPLLAASGARSPRSSSAQAANAFACRSTTLWPGRLGWTTNRLLIATASIELAFALTVVLVGPAADLLDHASPPLWGWVAAVASMPLLLAVDAVDKAHRRHRPAAH
jgi:hypothetical protein